MNFKYITINNDHTTCTEDYIYDRMTDAGSARLNVYGLDRGLMGLRFHYSPYADSFTIEFHPYDEKYDSFDSNLTSLLNPTTGLDYSIEEITSVLAEVDQLCKWTGEIQNSLHQRLRRMYDERAKQVARERAEHEAAVEADTKFTSAEARKMISDIVSWAKENTGLYHRHSQKETDVGKESVIVAEAGNSDRVYRIDARKERYNVYTYMTCISGSGDSMSSYASGIRGHRISRQELQEFLVTRCSSPKTMMARLALGI